MTRLCDYDTIPWFYVWIVTNNTVLVYYMDYLPIHFPWQIKEDKERTGSGIEVDHFLVLNG